MLMNRVETALMNSPPRRWLQRYYETPVLLRLGGGPLHPGERAAELGCGSGYGTELILRRFHAAQVDAVDLSPAMITHAARRLKGFGSRVRLAQGSATDLRTAFSAFGGGEGGADGSYDAVFDFGIIHHIPNWRDAIGEVFRVLRPGGRFFFDEVTAKALARPTYRWLLDHPQEDRFTAGQFIAELNRIGLRIGPENWRTRIGGDYLLGVATRARMANS